MGFDMIDPSHIIGSSPVAIVIFYVVVKVIKPLVESYLAGMTSAIKENTATVKELVEKQERVSEYQHAEHKEMTALLRILTDSLLRMNGDTPSEIDEVRKPKTAEERLLEIERKLGGK